MHMENQDSATSVQDECETVQMCAHVTEKVEPDRPSMLESRATSRLLNSKATIIFPGK